MAKLTKDQVVTAVYRQINDAEGYDNDDLAAIRIGALDYYYNRPDAAPSVPGRSALQSSDVADMVEAVVAQMMPAFEMANIAEFEPRNEDDVEQCRLESDAVANVIMQQNNGYYELQQCIRDALLMRNGIIKVWIDEKESVDVQTLKNLTVLEYGDLMRQDAGDLKQVDKGISVEELEERDGFYDVRVTIKNVTRKLKVESIDPTNFMWQREYDSIYLQDAQFCCERSFPTRSDLIESGYKRSIVSKLKPGGSANNTQTNARDRDSNTRNYQGETPATDIMEFYECYIRLDVDGDGIAELLKIDVCDKQILDMQEMSFVPYASGTPFLQPHRFNGLGLYDKLRYVQDAKTATLRQLLDNQNAANNSRVGVVDGMVNMDDVTNSRPGGVVRMTGLDAIMPFPFNDIGPSAQSTLNYMDKIRSERGGASLDLQSAELQLAGETAHGVERQMSAKEQLAAMMTRTLAETLIRSTWVLVHASMRMYLPDPVSFRVTDQFVSVNPSEWVERNSLNVKAGLSLAERARKKAALEQIVMRQDILQQQGKFVSEEDIYNAQLDWAHVQGINDPERYFTDPQSEEAQLFNQQQAQQAQEQKAYQERLLALQQSIEERKANNEDSKVIEDARQFDENLRYEYWKEQQSTEVKETEIATELALRMVDSESDENGGGSGTPKRANG
jgi:hypothetical protein